jgi:hypothetical protein
MCHAQPADKAQRFPNARTGTLIASRTPARASVTASEGPINVKKRTKQLLSALASSAFACAVMLPGCSGSDVATSPSPAGASACICDSAPLGGGGSSAGAGGRTAGAGGLSGGRANTDTDAGADGLSECNGIAPECRGTNLQTCCGNDPYGPATCTNGKWLCSIPSGAPPVPAPGCNGRICGLPFGEAGAGGEAGQAGAPGK